MGKHEIFKKKETQDLAYFYHREIKPSKMESAIAFVSLLTLLAVSIPLFMIFIIISFKCLKIILELKL